MRTILPKKCLQVAVQAAQKAGVLLLRHAGSPAKVETKRSPIDLVTEIDKGAETLIRRLLKRSFPSFGFLGEEHGAHNSGAEYRWIIDPIDGTMNFVHGIPLFGVSIALAQGRHLLAGVILDPSRRELYTATRGGGAFLNGRRIHVSKTKRLSHSILSTGFSAKFRKQPEPYLSWFRKFESSCHAVRRVGTTVLCLAWVASGRMEGFYEQDLWPWDVAAGTLLVQEAGGRVSDFAGKPPALENGRLVASNGLIHRAILNTLTGYPPRASTLKAR
jgi:myo-inositol-1(or 4)-monophosphatase